MDNNEVVTEEVAAVVENNTGIEIEPLFEEYVDFDTWKPINHATAVLLFASICNFYLIAAVLIVGVGKIVSYCYF